MFQKSGKPANYIWNLPLFWNRLQQKTSFRWWFAGFLNHLQLWLLTSLGSVEGTSWPNTYLRSAQTPSAHFGISKLIFKSALGGDMLAQYSNKNDPVILVWWYWVVLELLTSPPTSYLQKGLCQHISGFSTNTELNKRGLLCLPQPFGTMEKKLKLAICPIKYLSFPKVQEFSKLIEIRALADLHHPKTPGFFQ